jgi:hypothetical protein
MPGADSTPSSVEAGSRIHGGKDRNGDEGARIPPGQHVVQDFPVLSAGPTPRIAPEKWAFTMKIGPKIITSKVSARAVRRARLSRVVTAALLSEVAEVVALPDLRSEVPEDRVRNRDVEEEVGQHQVPDVVVAAEPPAHDGRRQLVRV